MRASRANRWRGLYLLSTALAGAATLDSGGWSAAYANPTGGQVVAGGATIAQTNPSTVTVSQSTERAVIDWQSFSIDAGQTTQFAQPNSSAVTLNRVTGNDLSTIAGDLSANGQIVLINPAGIVFSHGSQIDTSGLIATTTDIANTNFMAGRMKFGAPSTRPNATVSNQGDITIANAGLAALVAPAVANSGVIAAKLGKVVLAGAKTFTADLYGDGLVSFDMTSEVTEVPATVNGQATTALVSNTGQITADGGHILLTAQAVDGLITNLVDAGGTLRARSVGAKTGEVDVTATGPGVVSVTGAIDASGRNAGETGGTAQVLGDRVGLMDGASIDASGRAGGGTVLVGGNFHGGGAQQHAKVTYIAPTASITADAIDTGKGGSVAVWSDQQTAFGGSISAQGGANGGNGGVVEVSGKNLDFLGNVDVSAHRGAAGTLVLDPSIVNIDNNTDAGNNDNLLPTILATDNPGATDHLLADEIDRMLLSGDISIAATSAINVNAALTTSGGSGSLTLQAPAINLAQSISIGGSLVLNGAVSLQNVPFNAGPGFVTLTSQSGSVTAGAISDAAIAAGNELAVSGSTGITLNGVKAYSLSLSSSGTITLNAGAYSVTNGPLVFDSPVVTNGTLTLGGATNFQYIQLGSDTTLDASAANANVTVGGVDATTAGAQGLTINAGTGTVQLSNVGANAMPSFLDTATTGAGQTEILTNVAANNINLSGQVVFEGYFTLTTSAAGGVVVGNMTGSSGAGVVIDAGTGGIVLNGENIPSFIYGTSGPVTLNSGDYTIGGPAHYGNVTFNGDLSFGQQTSFGAVTLGSTVTVSSIYALSFASIDSASAAQPQSLTFTNFYMPSLTLGPVGATNPLSNLEVDTFSGLTTFGGNINAATVLILGPAQLSQSITIDAPSSVTFNQSVDATSPGGAALTFTADTGPVSLGTVGGTNPLSGLTALSTENTVTLGGNVSAGFVNLLGPVTVIEPVTIDTTSNPNDTGAITLGPVFAPSDPVLNAGAGAITLSGVQAPELVLNTTGVVTLNAGTYAIGFGAPYTFGNVTTNGALTLGQQTTFGTVTLGSATTLDSSAVNGLVTLGQVSGASGLTVNTGSGGVTFNGLTVAGLTVSTTGTETLNAGTYAIGTGPYSFGDVTTNGALTLGQATSFGAVTLGSDTTFDSSAVNGLVTLGPVSGSSNLTVTTGGGGATFNGVTANGLTITTTGTVTLDGGDYQIGDGGLYTFGPVTTNGTLSFGQPTDFGAVTLGSAVTVFSDHALSFASIDSASPGQPESLTIVEEGASLTLGAVGATNPLERLEFDAVSATVTLRGNVDADIVVLNGGTEVALPVTVDAPGSATFGDIDAGASGASLTFSADTGPVTLGTVGGTNPLAALTATSSNNTVTLLGNVYAGQVDLQRPVATPVREMTIDTTSNPDLTGAIALGPVTAGSTFLTLDAGAGAIALSGVAVAGLSLLTDGVVTLNGGAYEIGSGPYTFGAVTTNGALTFGQATNFGVVTLGGDTTLDSSGVNGALSLGQVSGSAFGLTIKTGSGVAVLSGVDAGALDLTGAGQVELGSGDYTIGSGPYAFGDVTTVGTPAVLTFGQPTSFAGLTLASEPTTLDSAAVNGALTLGPVIGNHALTLDTGSGAISLSGAQVSALTLTSTGTVTLNAGDYAIGTGPYFFGAVTTNGTLSFGQRTSFGAVTAASDTTFDSAYALAFQSIDSIDPTLRPNVVFGDAAMPSVTVGQVGGVNPLGRFEVDTSSGTTFLGGDVSANSVAIGGPTEISQVITVDAPTGAAFGNIDAGAPGASLTFSADTGPVTLGTVGGQAPLAGLTAVSRTSTVTLLGDVDAGQVDLAGPVSVVMDAVTIDTTSNSNMTGAITLGPVSGSASFLMLHAGGGAITLSGVQAALLSVSTSGVLTLDAGTYTIGDVGTYTFGDVTTNGVLTLGQPTVFGAVTLGSATTLDSSAVNGLLTLGPVTGSSALTVNTGGGGVTFGGLEVAGLTLDTSGAVTLDNGAYTIGTGPYTFGAVTTNGALTLGQPTSFGAVTLGSDTTLDSSAVNGLVTLGPVTGSSTLTVNTGSGGASFSGVDAGGLTIATTGTVTLNSGDYTIVNGQFPGQYDFPAVTTNGVLTFGQATGFTNTVTLGGDTTLDTSGVNGDLAILGAVTGAHTLKIVTGSGGIGLNGVDATGLTLTSTGEVYLAAGNYTIGNGPYAFGDVTTYGALTLGQATSFGAVTLGSATTLDSSAVNGLVTLGQVTGTSALTVNTGAGGTTFNGVDAAGLTITSTGTVTLDSGAYSIGAGPYAFGAVTTNGALLLGQPTSFGPVTLGSATTLDSSAVNGLVTLGPVAGSSNLIVNTGSGGANFSGVDAANLTIVTTGTVTLNSGDYTIGDGPYGFGNVTTNGTLTLGQATSFGAVTLGSATTLDSSAVNGLITLGQVTGASTLTVDTGSGGMVFGGLEVSGLTLDTTGTETLDSGTYTIGTGPYAFGDVTTNGVLTLGQPTSFGAVTLGSTTTLDSSAVNGLITLGQVTGSSTLTVSTGAGGATFNGVDAADLTIATTGTVTLDSGDYTLGDGSYGFGNVTTNGVLTFGQATSFGAVTLAGDTSLDSGFALSLGSADSIGPASRPNLVFGDRTMEALTLGPVGATDALGSLQVVSPEGYVTLTGNVSAATVTIAGPTQIANAVTIEAPTSVSLQAVYGDSPAAALTFGAGTGPISLGPVGGGDGYPLLGLTALSTTGAVTLNGDVFAESVALNGPVVLNGPNGSLTIDTTGNPNLTGGIALGPVIGAGSDLTLDAGNGAITLAGAQVLGLSLSTGGVVTLDGGTYAIAGSPTGYSFGAVTTGGDLILAQPTAFGAVTLGSATTLDSSAVNGLVTLGQVTGASSLTVTTGGGGATFAGVTASGLTVATTGTVTLGAGDYAIGAGPYAFGNVTTNGVLTLGQATSFGAVTLASDTSFDSAAASGALTLGSVTGAFGLTVNPGGAALTLNGVAVGAFTYGGIGVTTLNPGAYDVAAGGFTVGATQVGGAVTFGQAASLGAVSLTGDASLDSSATNGALAFGSVAGSGHGLSVNAGTGAVTVGGAIDGVASLTLFGGSVTLAGTLGGTTPIGAIDIASQGGVTLSQSATATGNISIAALGDGGNLAIKAAVNSGGAVTLTAGGAVSEGTNGAITASSLSVSAGGAIQLTGANSVAALGNVTADTFSFTDVATLTLAGSVNTVGDIAIDPPGGSIVIPAGTIVESQRGNIVLATTEAGADIIIDGSVRALGNPGTGGGTVLLSAGDLIDEQGQGVIQAAALTGSSGGATNLDGPNQIGLLGAFHAGGGLLIDNTVSLAVLGSGEAARLSLPRGASAPGTIQAAGDLVIANAADVSVDQGATLSGANVALGAFDGGGLTIGGAIEPTADAYLNAAGGLTIAATGSVAAAGTIRADAGGDMVTASGGALTAGQDIWIGYGASDYPAFPTLGYTAVSGVGGSVVDRSVLAAGRNIGLSGGAVTVASGATVTAGTASTGGIAFLNSAGTTRSGVTSGGAISIFGVVTARAGSDAGSGAVRLDAGGNIDEQGTSGTGTIVAASVTGASAGWTNLDGANQVGTLGGFSAGSTLTQAIDAGHPAGLSFTWNDAVPLTIAAAPDPGAQAVPPPGLPPNGQPPSPLPAVSVTTSTPDVTAPGSILITTSGNGVTIVGNVSVTSNDFIQVAGAGIDQTGGVLTLTAPLSVLDISGAPPGQLAALFGAGGANGISAFANGEGQNFLNRYETLVAAAGSPDPAARLRLASLVAPLAGSHVVMAVDQGSIVGTVDTAGIGIVSAGGPVTLTGILGGVSGTNAAARGLVSFGSDHSPYSSVIELNGCLVGSPSCISPTAVITYPNQPQTLSSTVAIESLSTFAIGSDAQESQDVIDAVYRAPFDEMLPDRRNSDLDVDRLNTGRENAQ